MLFSTPSRSQPPRSLGDRLAGKGEIDEKSSPSRRMTMFKPSRIQKLPQNPVNKPPSLSQCFERESSYSQRHSSGDFRSVEDNTSRFERIGDLPGTTAISQLLLEAPYSDPLAPPSRLLVWTTDMLRQRAPQVRRRYSRAIKDELEHPPGACVDLKTGIHACLFATSPLHCQISDALQRIDLSP